MAKKSSFMDKLVNRTTDKTATKLADKISSGIVKSVTAVPKKKSESKAKPSESGKPAPAADKTAQDMAVRYNTKICPNCQGVCFNSPADCPYCFQDLRKVKPLSPKEFDELDR